MFPSYVFFILVCVFGSSTPQDTQQTILIQLNAIVQKIDGLETKMTLIEGLETKMTLIEESIKTLEERIIGQQEDIKTSIQQEIRDQITTFQHLIEEDECEEGSTHCSASATCTDAFGHYKCVCIQGYSGDGFTCEDIDECNTNDAICGEGGTCINHPGTYGCVCHDGFREVNNFCTDVDECSESTNALCGAEQICSNFPGNYSCTCRQEGYEKEGDNCQDINECASDVHLCSANATCINTEGSYTCQCLLYHYGDGYTCNDCQTELDKKIKVLLDPGNIAGIDELTSTIQKNLIESLGQEEPQCARKKTNCKDLLDNYGVTASGVYRITPEGFPDGVEVYCDQVTDGGGWTVILQRKRQSHQLNFVRTFVEYAAGFGDPNGEIYIGNRILHSMTGDKPFTLRVDAKNHKGRSRTGIWNTFSVGSQHTQFILSVAGYSSSSTLGDCLTRSGGNSINGMKFSTYDRDNDNTPRYDCSARYGKGGWFYNGCSSANPTAPLGNKDDKFDIAHWGYWKRSSSYWRPIALAEIIFKIRPNY